MVGTLPQITTPSNTPLPLAQHIPLAARARYTINTMVPISDIWLDESPRNTVYVLARLAFRE
jgi:hypothetical protein